MTDASKAMTAEDVSVMGRVSRRAFTRTLVFSGAAVVLPRYASSTFAFGILRIADAPFTGVSAPARTLVTDSGLLLVTSASTDCAAITTAEG